MAYIDAAEEQTFVVTANMEDVYRTFADPEVIQRHIHDLESWSLDAQGNAHWIIKEKSEKGVRFKGDYTVRYQGNGTDHVTWNTVTGNIKTKGEARLTRLDVGVRVDYREEMAPDLPIPRLLATVFKPIVAREVRKGILDYLDSIKRSLNETRG